MIALFIGSFNPPTKAHINICLKLKNDFEKIVLVPVNSNDKKLINIKDRINMLEIYTRKYPFLVLDDIMKNYSYVNYRIIDLLKEKYGALQIIIGSDVLDKLSSFDNYEYLLDNYSFYVLERENNSVEIIKKKYLKYQDKFKVIKFNQNISSTLARELIKNKKNPENVLDSDVYDYIKKNHLY